MTQRAEGLETIEVQFVVIPHFEFFTLASCTDLIFLSSSLAPKRPDLPHIFIQTYKYMCTGVYRYINICVHISMHMHACMPILDMYIL